MDQTCRAANCVVLLFKVYRLVCLLNIAVIESAHWIKKISLSCTFVIMDVLGLKNWHYVFCVGFTVLFFYIIHFYHCITLLYHSALFTCLVYCWLVLVNLTHSWSSVRNIDFLMMTCCFLWLHPTSYNRLYYHYSKLKLLRRGYALNLSAAQSSPGES